MGALVGIAAAVPSLRTLPPNAHLAARAQGVRCDPSPRHQACARPQPALGRCGGRAALTAAPGCQLAPPAPWPCIDNPAVVVVRGGRRSTRCRCTCRTPRRCTARRAAAAATAAAMERPAWRGCAARWRRGAWCLWWRAPPPPRSRCPPPLPLALDMGDAAFLGPRKQCHQTRPPLRVILRAAWVPPPPFWSSLPADILTRLQLSV